MNEASSSWENHITLAGGWLAGSLGQSASVVTMLAEMGISLELVAAVIGHEAGGRETRTLMRHYVRTDLIERKRTVLEAWDRMICSILNGTTMPGNVATLALTASPHAAAA